MLPSLPSQISLSELNASVVFTLAGNYTFQTSYRYFSQLNFPELN